MDMVTETFVHLAGEFDLYECWIASLTMPAAGQQELADVLMDEAAEVSEIQSEAWYITNSVVGRWVTRDREPRGRGRSF